jgi:protein-tyrosine phosphatase
MPPHRILFVCMGNICRSPMAEAVMQHLVDEAGLSESIIVDSAATHAYHIGEMPHRDTLRELAKHGIDGSGQRARGLTLEDLSTFDDVVVMDDDNFNNVVRLARESGGLSEMHARVTRLLDHAFERPELEVPDPYYEGGFDHVYELVLAGCEGLLTDVERT